MKKHSKYKILTNVFVEKLLVQPGECAMLTSSSAMALFKPTLFGPPEGVTIEYSAFTCTQLFVGNVNQLPSATATVPVAKMLREQKPLSVLHQGMWLTMGVRNDGDVPLPFVLLFAGEVIR